MRSYLNGAAASSVTPPPSYGMGGGSGGRTSSGQRSGSGGGGGGGGVSSAAAGPSIGGRSSSTSLPHSPEEPLRSHHQHQHQNHPGRQAARSSSAGTGYSGGSAHGSIRSRGSSSQEVYVNVYQNTNHPSLFVSVSLYLKALLFQHLASYFPLRCLTKIFFNLVINAIPTTVYM